MLEEEKKNKKNMLSWIVIFSGFFIVISQQHSDLFNDSDESDESTDDAVFRIIQGSPIAIEKVPYQAAIEKLTQLWCGAVILSEDVVVTAAHCVTSPKSANNKDNWFVQIAKNLTVFTRIRVGANYTRSGGKLHSIKNLISHENYTGSIDYDIALIRVNTPFTFSNRVQPIPLATEEPKAGEMGLVTGYGRTKPMKRSIFGNGNQLLTVSMPIIDHEKCKRIFKRRKLAISERMICAGYTDSRTQDACQGDSGGPLVVNKKLVGIVSWGIGCGRKGLPGVYMSVPKFLNWIEITKNKLYSKGI